MYIYRITVKAAPVNTRKDSIEMLLLNTDQENQENNFLKSMLQQSCFKVLKSKQT